MASKKRSVLFERNSASNGANNADNSEPEPSSRSGIYPAATRDEAETSGEARVAKGPLAPEAIEAFVAAHVLSRL